MGTLNNFGYQTTDLSSKKLELQNLFKSIFGDDILLTDSSPQGQLINYLANLNDNEDKIGLNFFESLDYHNATGGILSLIAISKGQPRIDGTKATITTTFTSSDVGYTITAGSVFAYVDNNELTFTNNNDIVISSTTQTVDLEAINKGETGLIPTNTLIALNNYPALTNIEIIGIVDGANIESDNNLILRLDESDTETGINDFNSITDKLGLIANVSRKRVFDNNSNVEVNGVPARNIFCQVVGGNDEEIAQVILNNKATGTETFGNTSYDLIDSDGYPKIIYFNRPTVENVYIKITLTSINSRPIDTSNFSNLKNQTQQYINENRIGDNVYYSKIYGIWAVGGIFAISKLELSYDDITYYETDLAISFTKYSYMSNISQIEILYTT